ncbi:MAG: translocation/assembly module TamB [Deltaproteobacteria bacterium]|nr:translocation/assembly module TamB [Deltaproteobacteria bacterium]
MIRKIRKHFLKLFFAAILLTVTFLFFFLRSGFVGDKVYHYTRAYLEDRLQSRIVMGRPEISWLRGRCYIKDLSIRPDFGREKKEFVTAKGVRISFLPWWNVLKMEIGIRSIQVEEPTVYLRVEKRKISNLPSFDFLKGGKGFFRFDLREVAISKGKVALSYPEIPSDVSLSGIEMKIRPDIDKGHFGFLLANSEANIMVKEFSHKILSLKGDFSITPENLTIINSSFLLPEGHLSLEGLYLEFAASRWETKVSSELNLDAVRSVASGQWPVVSEKFQDLKGKVNLSAAMKGDGGGVEVRGLAKAGEIELDGFNIRETTSGFSSKGRWNSLKESPFEIDLRSKIPVELARHYVSLVPDIKGVADVHIKCSVAGGQWSVEKQKIKIEGDVASQPIEVAGMPVNKVSAKFHADLETVRIEEVTADLLGGSLKGALVFALKEDKRFSGQVTIEDMNLNDLGKLRPLNSAPGAALGGGVSGDMTVTGSISPELTIDGSSTMQIRDLDIAGGSFSTKITVANLKTRISHTRGVTKIKSLDIETPSSAASVSGEVSDGNLSLELYINSSELNELTGHLIGGSGKVKARVTGDIHTPSVYGNLSLSEVFWKGYNADTVSGNVGFKEQALTSTGLLLRHGSSEVFLKGELSLAKESPWLNAVVEMEKGRLEDISSMAGIDLPAKGNVSLTGRVKGEIRSLHGDIGIEGSGMTVGGEDIDAFSLAGRLEKGSLLLQKVEISRDKDKVAINGSIDTQGEMHLTLSSSPLVLGNLTFVKRNKIPVDGTLELKGDLSGNMRNPTFNGLGVFNDAGYRNINLGSGTLEMSVSDRTLNVSGPLFGVDVNGEMTLQGSNPFHLTFAAKDLSLTSYFKGKTSLEGLTGVLSGTLKAEGELSSLNEVSAKGHISKLQVERGPFLLENEKEIEAELRNGKIVFNSFHLSGKGTELHTSGWIGMDGETNLLINGNLDIYLLQIFTKAIEKGEGVADIKLAISGKPPEIKGTIVVRDGVVVLKGFDHVFRDISGAAVLNGETLTVETLTGRIGEGSFNGNGIIEMAGIALKRTDLRFDVSGLRLAYPSWLPGEVEGSLRLTGEYPLLLLSGDINVVKARYSERVDWATLLLSFRQRLKEPRTIKEEGGALRFDINFNADRNVIFENNVGKGELKGAIRLKRDTGRIGIVGNVEVITGKFFYKEHEFKILSGVIEFPDPKKIEAVLDFTAEGKVRDYTIQILAMGNINDLKVTMTSSPPLSELDIASLLSVGLTSKEFMATGVVAPAYQAASILSRELEGRFKDYIGFDRFHIDPYYSKATGTTEPKLTVGKDISEDILVIYSRSLSGAGEQEAQVEYRLYRNLSVIGGWSSFGASQSGDVGADIKFRFEFR